MAPGESPPDADESRSLRERVAGSRRRRRIAARRAMEPPYRVLVAVVGTLVLAVGIVAIPLPGPGWLIVIAGLFVLATEFGWAERLLEYTRHRVGQWTEWLGRQSVLVRLGIAVLTAAFVFGVVVVTLHVTGVPQWTPGWVPLWR